MLPEPDVRKRPAPLPEGGQDGAPCERLERQRPHELLRARGEDDIHRGTSLGKPPGEDAALIARDPARHAENDVPAGPHAQASERRRRTSLNSSSSCTSASSALVVSFSSCCTIRSRGSSFR